MEDAEDYKKGMVCCSASVAAACLLPGTPESHACMPLPLQVDTTQ